MKKSLFLLATAAVVLAGCNNDVTIDENVAIAGSNAQKEIGFAPLSQNHRRAQYAVLGNTFPEDNLMEVKAYQTQPSAIAYFDKTTFKKDATEAYWRAWDASADDYAPKYWPLSAAKINFFAVSGHGVNAANITIADALASATVTYTTAQSYSATTQSDIMYAFGRGEVTKDGNTLSFNSGNSVQMVFKHALALIDFEVKAFSEVEEANITVNSITLKNATYNGTLTLTNTNAATESDAVTTAVSWAAGDAVAAQLVPDITTHTAISDDAYARIGKGLMVIPGTGFSSFVINYTFDGKDYDYEYTPSPAVSSTTAANKYTYRITFKLHEITIAPEITPWTNTNNDITIYE